MPFRLTIANYKLVQWMKCKIKEMKHSFCMQITVVLVGMWGIIIGLPHSLLWVSPSLSVICILSSENVLHNCINAG